MHYSRANCCSCGAHTSVFSLAVGVISMCPTNVQGLSPQGLNAACRHLVRNPSIAWEDIPDLPNAAKQLLADRFTHCTSQVVSCQTSASKDTSKLLLRLQDGMEVEAVIMHYDTSGVWPLHLAVL